MPEYLHPGVFIEEIERGPRPIEGVPTSTAAFLGEAERGTINPRLVTSYNEYRRWFGGVFGDDKFLPYAAYGFFENGGKRMFVCRIVGKAATPAQATFGQFIVRAAGPGTWGRRVWARVDDSTAQKTDANGNRVPVGFRLRLAYWDGNTVPFDPFTDEDRRALPRPSLIEDFDDLVTDEHSPDFFGRRVPFIDLGQAQTHQGPESSALGMLVRSAAAPSDARPINRSLALEDGGTDHPAPLDSADYMGVPAGARLHIQGLSALERDPYREIALAYAPGVANDIALAIIAHCENMRFRFALIDSPRGQRSAGDIDPRATMQADTHHAAFYCPWIVISDPETGARKLVPPGGHVAGVYARTDVERGVFKAPANETLRGAIDLEYEITDETGDMLNKRGVNVIRRFPGRGIRVWGARTPTSNALWKYVNVRRLFIFLERSIYEGTQWVVFESNDARLWARVSDTIRLFLRAQWRLGALVGRTEEQAFFIKCDKTTMTQDDILNGRLVCEVGIAPVRPAEFVIFRIFQNTAEARQ